MDLLAQHEAFLRAIFDAPDDDTPRLVYADFLQENGEEERAEFIRAECELAGIRRTGKGGRDNLREFDLLQRSVRLATKIDARRPAAWLLRFETDRGFPLPWATITLTVAQLESRDDLRRHLVHDCPECFAVRGAKVCGGRIASSDPWDVLFGLPALALVTELNLEGELIEESSEDSRFSLSSRVEPVVTTAGVHALAHHHGTRQLTSLILTNNDLDNDAARALVKSPYLGNLKRLRLLEGNRLRGKVWQEVIERFGEDVVE